jgi:osmotically inducible protein OsmC
MTDPSQPSLRNIVYRTPAVTSVGGRAGTVRSGDGLLELQVAIPKEMGGPGEKLNPEMLFAAGYAACFHSAVKGVAGKRDLDVGASTIEAHVSIGPLAVGSGYGLAVELHVTLPGIEAEIADEVVREAHTICPYSNATRGNVDVRLTVTPADGKIRAVV